MSVLNQRRPRHHAADDYVGDVFIDGERISPDRRVPRRACRTA